MVKKIEYTAPNDYELPMSSLLRLKNDNFSYKKSTSVREPGVFREGARAVKPIHRKQEPVKNP